MAGTFAFDASHAPCGGASSVDFDTTGGNITLPSDTQQLEISVDHPAWYKRGAYDGTTSWLRLEEGTSLIRELDGLSVIGLKADSTSVVVTADAISPRGVAGGR